MMKDVQVTRVRTTVRGVHPIFAAISAMFAVFAVTAGPAAMADAGALRQIVREAERDLAAGDPARALERLTDARRLAPDSAPIAYNQGVAAWRAGDAGRAMTYFREALDRSDDPALRARAAYNLGTAAHRSLIEGSASTDDLGEAQAMLEDAIERYREALSANPADVDAQANGEMAWRLLEELRALADAQSQEESGADGEQDGEPSAEQERNGSHRDGSDGDGDAQANGTEGTPEDGGGGDPSGAQDAAGQPDDAGSDPADAPSSASSDDAPSEDPSAAPSGDDADDAEREAEGDRARTAPPDATAGMSREEAERMLQIIRDGEARRREELRRRQRAAASPVERDW